MSELPRFNRCVQGGRVFRYLAETKISSPQEGSDFNRAPYNQDIVKTEEKAPKLILSTIEIIGFYSDWLGCIHETSEI